jgi:large subunit ribosomal protein L21
MKYAIVESGGKQYKAVEGDTLEVDRLPLEAGKTFNFERVLLTVSGDEIRVGTPVVGGVSVSARVLEHFKGLKTINFQYRPKKRIRQKTGHRQLYTRLSVQKIEGVKEDLAARETKAAAKVKEEKVVEAVSAPTKAAKPGPKEVKAEKAKPETPKAKPPVKPAAKQKTTAKPAAKPAKPAPKTKTKPAAKPSSKGKKPAVSPSKGKKTTTKKGKK